MCAIPLSSPSSRHRSSASPSVCSATSYAPAAISASPSMVDASRVEAQVAGFARLGEDGEDVGAGAVEVSLLDLGSGPPEERGPPRRAGLVGKQRQGTVVVPAGNDPRLDALGAGRGLLERGHRLLAHVGRHARHRAQLDDELGRGRELVGDLIDARLTELLEHPGQAGVAAGALGLGERAVGDLVHELRLEVELVVVELDQIAFGEPAQQWRRVGAVGEPQHERDLAGGADDGAVLEHRSLGRVERVEPRREQAVQGRGHLA